MPRVSNAFKDYRWTSSDPKIIGIKTYLLENFSQEKAPENSRWPFLGSNPLKVGNYTICRCSKILGEADKQEILQQKMLRKF